MEIPDQRNYLVGDTGVARDLLADFTKQYLNRKSRRMIGTSRITDSTASVFAFDADAEGIKFTDASSEEIEADIWERMKAQYPERSRRSASRRCAPTSASSCSHH